MNRNTCIKSYYISIIFKLFFAAICGYGLFMHISFVNIYYNIHMFSYFTVLTNLLCFLVIIYQIIATIIMLAKSKLNNTLPDFLSIYTKFLRFFRGTALMSIILTFGVYHFMVAKYKYPLLYHNVLCLPTRDFIAHYIVPLLFVLDWLMFQPKPMYGLKSPIYWISYPLLYVITIMFRSFCLPRTHLLYLEKYPYFFFNVEKIGISLFCIYMVLMIFLILIIGYSIVAIEKIFDFISRKFH